MNAVVYYSNSNQSYKIAKYLSYKSSYNLVNLKFNDNYVFNNLILVFPVYCQNIPDEVKKFVKKIEVKNISIISTYGRKSFGNVVYEVAKLNNMNVISYGYIPTKHTYIKNDKEFSDYKKLDDIVEKFKTPSCIKIKRYFKNPFANIFMLKRSQFNIKIIKTNNCNGCTLCNEICSNISKGEISNNCIRCLKCVDFCPKNALIIRKSLLLKVYLKLFNKNKLVIKI